jgi:hypothetical protein
MGKRQPGTSRSLNAGHQDPHRLQALQPQSPQAQHWHSTHWQVPHLQQLHDAAGLPVASAASLALTWVWTSWFETFEKFMRVS